jgi:hypothetical protein
MSKNFDSKFYWKQRYAKGGNSGPGSYGKLADFKAEILNQFVQENKISTVAEYGCGDGNQLQLANYPHYIGYDVSEKAIEICKEKFFEDSTKSFYLLPCEKQIKCDLTLSLDVVFHLIEDQVYEEYMKNLFDNSHKFVAIYSSNHESKEKFSVHVKHRKFTHWIDENCSNFELVKFVDNKFPFGIGNKTESFSNFYFYKKMI